MAQGPAWSWRTVFKFVGFGALQAVGGLLVYGILLWVLLSRVLKWGGEQPSGGAAAEQAVRLRLGPLLPASNS